MFQPLHNGALGLTGQQRSIDVIGNNVANINTLGFKADRLDFQDTLYTRMFNKVNMGAEMNLQRGTGVRTYQTATRFMQGSAMETGRELDVMLQGNGFFVYENPMWDGETEMDEFLYTRDASLYLTDIEGVSYLVNAQGNFIMDQNLERIVVEGAPTNFSVSQTGAISYINENGDIVNLDSLLYCDFVNREGLVTVGNGFYMQTPNSGEQLESDATVVQGYTEASNVDLAEEMTNLVRAQRSYQLAARVVTTADQMMQVCNQLGR